VDTDRVRVLLRASILNLFDRAYAYNFGNPFSGTHFGAPRTAAVGVQVTFR
jgi:outer membrane receptor protein involved in Fe transport